MNTRCGWGGVARTSRDPVWCNKSTVISLANRRGRVGCWTLERQCGLVPIHATTPLGGALDRLFTYARGEALSDTQKAAMRAEGDLRVDPAPSLADVAADMNASIERALEQLRTTTRDDLLTARTVGRAELPTTTLGLLFHAAEHSTRHAGQAISTAKILAGS